MKKRWQVKVETTVEVETAGEEQVPNTLNEKQLVLSAVFAMFDAAFPHPNGYSPIYDIYCTEYKDITDGQEEQAEV